MLLKALSTLLCCCKQNALFLFPRGAHREAVFPSHPCGLGGSRDRILTNEVMAQEMCALLRPIGGLKASQGESRTSSWQELVPE